MNTTKEPKTYWGKSLLQTQNAKTTKGEDLGYLTGILYLAPARESLPFGGKNTCAWASKGCADVCIFHQGRGKMQNVRTPRIEKTLLFFSDRDSFLAQLRESICDIIRKAEKEGLTPCIRLNGTSDIGWDKHGIIQEFPNVQFYDYTKSIKRVMDNKLANYHLTFSRSETNGDVCREVIRSTHYNVAIAFNVAKGDKLPKTYLGRPVIDGDLHDLRFLDPEGCIVGLRAKGTGKQDESGFVVNV